MENKAISWLEQIDKNHFVECHGLYYEDFVIGAVIDHRPGRTITETDNIWQSLINMNTHPLHIDRTYGDKTEFQNNLVSSLVTFSIIGGLSLSSTSMRAVANLGWREVKLPHPVYVGDTLFAQSKILSKRISESRPNNGIVTIQTRGLNQDGIEVLVWERSFLVPLKTMQIK